MSSFEPLPLASGGDVFESCSTQDVEIRFRTIGAGSAPEAPPSRGAEAPLDPSEPDRPAAPPAPGPEEIRKAAFEDGRKAGRAELPWTEAEALRAARTALERSASALATVRLASLASQQTAVVDLALAVAEKLVGRALAHDAHALRRLVQRALSRLDGAEPAVVSMSEADLETLRGDADGTLERLASRDVRLECDPSLGVGDVEVRAGSLRVDARISEVLAALRSELAQEISTEHAWEPDP